MVRIQHRDGNKGNRVSLKDVGRYLLTLRNYVFGLIHRFVIGYFICTLRKNRLIKYGTSVYYLFVITTSGPIHIKQQESPPA